MDNERTDGQCATDAMMEFVHTKTGKWILTAIVLPVVAFMGYLGIIEPEVAEKANAARNAMLSENLATVVSMQHDVVGLQQNVLAAARQGNVPERVYWDLTRLEGLSMNQQAVGIAFMDVSRSFLSEEDFNAILDLSVERLASVRSKLEFDMKPIPKNPEEREDMQRELLLLTEDIE